MPSVTQQCNTLGISRSSAYYMVNSSIDERAKQVLGYIRQVLAELPFYGYRKVFREVTKRYMSVSEKQVRRIMARAGLQAIYPPKNLSKAWLEHKKYPYLLSGKQIRYPNQVWATDLTYIRVENAHVYLMAIIDLYSPTVLFKSRKVLNWIVSNTLDALVFSQCLSDTLEHYGSLAIFNTDQGCQFTSDCWTQILHEYGVSISMDGKGCALDTIFIERLWRSLKYADIYIKHYESVRELKSGIKQYFCFYNTKRFHQALDYRTPDETYEKDYKQYVL